jgi:hypothetical protein
MDETIIVNGVEYVKKQHHNENPYVCVRTYSAGVFFGNLVRRDGKEVELANARRIWYWSGAASLSQLATEGTNDPNNCKFPKEVPLIVLTEAIEIIPTTKKAEKSIKGVVEWKI